MKLTHHSIPVAFFPYRHGRVFMSHQFLQEISTDSEQGASLLKSLDTKFMSHYEEDPESELRQFLGDKLPPRLDNHTCYVVKNETGSLLGFWHHDGNIIVGNVSVQVRVPKADGESDITNVLWTPEIPFKDVIGY